MPEKPTILSRAEFAKIVDLLAEGAAVNESEEKALLAHDAAQRAEIAEAGELLAEVGGWCKYEGFYRLGNRINVFLGGTEWGDEKLLKPGGGDNWKCELEEERDALKAEIERLRAVITKATKEALQTHDCAYIASEYLEPFLKEPHANKA